MTGEKLDQPQGQHGHHGRDQAASTSTGDAFAVSMHHDQDVGTIVLAGELDLNGVPQLAATVDQLLHQNVTLVRIDTTDLRFVDSCGLSSLLQIQATARAAGAELRLDGTTGAVARVIHMAGLTDVLTPGRGGPQDHEPQHREPL